jgi:superfamily II DNA or RNA helicase
VAVVTKIIILDNKKCQIFSEDTDLLKRLHTYLSFKLAGVEYTPAYQNGWNGITYLLSKSNKFNYGLLSKVESFLKDRNILYTVEDRRAHKSVNVELNIEDNLKRYKLIPRDHQIKICQAAYSNDRGIIRAATGSGKTLCTALITAKLNKPTIVYVIGLDLLDQFYKLYCKLFNEPIGYIGNGVCNIKRINIASIWTIGRSLKLDTKDIIDDDDGGDNEKELDENNRVEILNLLNETKVHIFDESHVVTTNTISEIYKNINPEHMYGFSGTPFRDDNSDLQINGILGEQIIDISASELIDKNLLAMPLIKFYTVPKMSVSSTYPTVYKEYIVENSVRNDMIVRLAQELINKKYTPLVLFKQIRHGDILLEKFLEKNIKCEMLYGNDSLDRRNEVKDKLVKKEINLILASTIFDLGLDLPELNALILCGGGKSRIRALQRIGRVIRAAPGKKFAAVVDFYDQVKFLKKHSTIRYGVYLSEPGFKVIKSREMK